MRRGLSKILLVAIFAFLGPVEANAQVTSQRLEHAASEPQNWMLYGRTFDNQRYSTLKQITQGNVKNMEQQWVFQTPVSGPWETTPLVVNGIMYVTSRPDDVEAVDAKTGKLFWIYHWTPAPNQSCCGSNNRGVAILGDTLFLGTLDAHLIALDAKTGTPLWNTVVADVKNGYNITMAPMVVKDKVLVGTAGGEEGIRGFIAAYDPRTGKEIWRFNTIPTPGEPGSETWTGDTWKHGGGPVWNAGAYDPALNLVYFGVGNPGPDFNPAQRPGDNLYTDCVVALDVNTGKMKWYFQFTPSDAFDFDATQVPILADMDWNGKPAKVMLWGNRNGIFYVLDRVTGKFLLGKPYGKVTWATSLDENGRPVEAPLDPGVPVWPGSHGLTNWWAAAYSPRTELFYINAWDNYAQIFHREQVKYEQGRNFSGGGGIPYSPVPPGLPPGLPQPSNSRPGPIDYWTNETGNAATVALDPHTGKRVWSFRQFDFSYSAPLVTATDLLFSGGRDGYFYAFNAKTGKVLWKKYLGGPIYGSITYAVDNKQYVSVVAGNDLDTFALRN